MWIYGSFWYKRLMEASFFTFLDCYGLFFTYVTNDRNPRIFCAESVQIYGTLLERQTNDSWTIFRGKTLQKQRKVLFPVENITWKHLPFSIPNN